MLFTMIKIEFLFYIVLSAFLHSFYNFLMKKNSGERKYLYAIFIVAALISLAASAFSQGYRNVAWNNVPYIYGAAFFYVLYQEFANKSYQSGSMTTNYPLTVLSPLFIPIWAYFLLFERISFLAVAGICVTVLGAVAVQLESFSGSDIKKMFKLNRDFKGAGYALTASLMYSFGAILDKSRVASFPITTYLSLIVGFMALNMTIHMLFSDRAGFFPYVRNNWKTVIAGGIILFCSFLFFRLALPEINVSIAVPIRQVSIIFAVLLGAFGLKEGLKPVKIAASLIIICGVALISIGS